MRELAPRRRAGILLGILLLGLVGLVGRLTYVQGIRADEYTDQAHRQRVREVVLPARRGAIYDRHGRELAMSVPARTIYANPRVVRDPAAVAARLAPLLDAPEGELLGRLRSDRAFVYLARQVPVEVAQQVEGLDIVGVDGLDEARRVYPGGSLAATVTGFVGTDGVGLAGLEYAYEDLLGGEDGVRVLEQDPMGRRIPQGVFREDPPVSGSDIVLTIDRDVQHAAERALARAVEETSAAGGVVVVLDPRTGELLAMANRPTFDPNDLEGLELSHTRNRAVTDTFEPGSVSKVVTAAAALELGLVDPETPFGVPDRIVVGGEDFHDAYRHATRTMLFRDVIARSSNVGTIKVALQLGPERLSEYLHRFGYGEPTGLGLPGEVSGVLPPTDRWRTSLPTMAIGQGLSATPLQLARIYGAIANDGVSLDPKLVSGWIDPSGGEHEAASSRPERIVGAGAARTLRDILRFAVTDGTGTRAAIDGYAVGGKTGTAQKPSPTGGYSGFVASFVGFLPVEQPEVAVAVVLDEPSPYEGGVVAAPVFREVGTAAIRALRIAPDPPPSSVPEGSAAGERQVAAGR